ncbi:polyprenol phosphomannose-dependent alpha 1,6 mannosyltransferase MptB [Mobilicoccus sp.]|uniref:polyprenol phosphomannose-dependent alpha 1,6 mannosyltransferase MptB n=1 Tax=Mobilicoccus sp. TaxID=2034349 RepID=UPI0028AEA701|nr:polyprenol phosphomannose-dependent alpha 1,6 mannosyltransferase MptB [Mobilicoccus sp.]
MTTAHDGHDAGVLASSSSTAPTSSTHPPASTRSTRALVAEAVRRARVDLAEAWAAPLVRQGFVAMVLIALGAFSPAFVAEDAPLYQQPFFAHLLSEPARFAATAILLVGLLRLFDVWLRLRPTPGRPTAPVAAWAWWSLPIACVPPLFSRDAYSYAAQGLVVSRGMDPYRTGPIAVPGPFADQVDPIWLYTPAPYGPLALQVQRLVVDLTGGDALLSAIAMRVPALLAVGVIAYALPRLAERMGVSRDQAVWLGVLNPLVLMHLVGGMHNDAVMIALVVVGLLLASDGRWVAGSIAVAAGAGFKQTAVLALVGVAGLAYRHARGLRGEAPLLSRVDQWSYVRQAAKVGLVAFAAFTGLTVLTGMGWGWIANLGVPGSILSLLAPFSMLGAGIAALLAQVGVPAGYADGAIQISQTVGLVGVLVGLAWITWVLAPRRPVAAAAWALLVFTFGGPTVYPWYVLWGLILLGATSTHRRVVQVMCVVVGWLIAYSMLDLSVVNGAGMLGIAAVAWGAVNLLRRRGELGTPMPPVIAGDADSGAPDEHESDQADDGADAARARVGVVSRFLVRI